MDSSTDWGTALAILAAGLVFGLLVFVFLRRRNVSAASHRQELEARRDELLQQLRDLGDDGAAEQERASLERETAGVLRALDQLPPASKAAGPQPAPRRRSTAAGFVWGAAGALVLGGIVYYGSTFARQRGGPAEPAPLQPPAAAEATAQDPGGLPPDHPPFPGMESAREPASFSQPIQITLFLDPSSTLKSGVVYVIARGAEAGHPVAVRRVDAPGFPLSLELGLNDAMMGQPLPPKVRIEARLDSDGDAGTTAATDPSAAVNGVPSGASVELTLRKGD